MNVSLIVKNVTGIKSGIMISVSASKNLKEHRVCKKWYFWNPARCSFENGKYAEIIIGDTVGISDEIIDATKSTSTQTVPTQTVPTKCTLINFCILLSFLLINIA